MICAAVFRAEKVILAGLARLKPHGSVLSGNRVLFYSKGRNIEAVYDILRSEGQFHRSADGNVKLIDLAPPVRMLNLPHPLPSHNVDVLGALRRNRLPNKKSRSPYEHHKDEDHRHRRPEQLQSHNGFGLLRFPARPAAILDRESDDKHDDKRGKECGHRDEESIELIDLNGER